MSRAVRIRAISVEVKWTVMSRPLACSSRPTSCVRERNSRKNIYQRKKETMATKGGKVQRSDAETKRRAGFPIPVPVLFSPCFSLGSLAAGFFTSWGMMPEFKGRGTHHSVGLLQGPKNVFDQDSKTVSQGKGVSSGRWLHSLLQSCSTIHLSHEDPKKAQVKRQ